MPKAVFVAPPLNTADIPEQGANVLIDDVRIATEQWTKLGTVKKGLGLDVIYQDKKYSQLFSLDAKVLTGSIGRILVSVGIDDTDTKDFPEKVKALIGKEIKVVKKEGKIYWYPTLPAQ